VINKPLRKEESQVNKISDEKEDIKTNTNEIESSIRDYFQNLHSNELENLEEMSKFLDVYDYQH
jgi:hypothetical protein